MNGLQKFKNLGNKKILLHPHRVGIMDFLENAIKLRCGVIFHFLGMSNACNRDCKATSRRKEKERDKRGTSFFSLKEHFFRTTTCSPKTP